LVIYHLVGTNVRVGYTFRMYKHVGGGCVQGARVYGIDFSADTLRETRVRKGEPVNVRGTHNKEVFRGGKSREGEGKRKLNVKRKKKTSVKKSGRERSGVG